MSVGGGSVAARTEAHTVLYSSKSDTKTPMIPAGPSKNLSNDKMAALLRGGGAQCDNHVPVNTAVKWSAYRSLRPYKLTSGKVCSKDCAMWSDSPTDLRSDKFLMHCSINVGMAGRHSCDFAN